MGINAVLVCERHRVKTHMMRGEEPWDLQRWMREDHADCFESGLVTLHRDADDYPDYPDAYDHEHRPALQARRR